MLLYIGTRDISGFTMIELITTSIFVFSSIYGGTTYAMEPVLATTSAPGASARIEEQAATSILTKKELEKMATAYFKNDPILVDIARCESRFRQFDKNGD